MLNFLVILFKKLPLRFSQYPLNQKSVRQREKASLGLPTSADILASININALIRSEIQGIILDLDNTVVSEDDRYLSPYAEDWLIEARGSGIKLFILSNGKRHYRVEYWSKYLDIPAINPARKPFPGSFRKALRLMKLKPKQVVVIGDSRHTDVLGAWFVGCPCIQVASLPHPPRWWEKVFGKHVQNPYPLEQKLWNFNPSTYFEQT